MVRVFAPFSVRSSTTKGGSSRNERLERVVSVLGGYGIFGGRVAEALALERELPGPRGRAVARGSVANFAHRIGAEFREVRPRRSRQSLRQAIDGSFLVIHAAGPFQGADYQVAELVHRSWGLIISTWRTHASSSPGSAGSTTRRASAG